MNQLSKQLINGVIFHVQSGHIGLRRDTTRSHSGIRFASGLYPLT